MITRLIWTIRTSLSAVPRKAVKFNYSLTRGFETSRDLMIRRLIRYWNGALVILFRPQCVYQRGLRTHVCIYGWSSLVQIMAWPLLSAKPLPEPMLFFCHWELHDHYWFSNCQAENGFENVVCKISTVVFRSPCVNHFFLLVGLSWNTQWPSSKMDSPPLFMWKTQVSPGNKWGFWFWNGKRHVQRLFWCTF